MKNENQNKKVFVAMSGGVDSAVSAALLVDQGYDVTGVYMKNWSGDDFGIQDECPWEQDQSDAENVCKHLGIPFRSFNFEKQYRDKVVEYFFDEYKKGRTPNPDVMCNKEIKFKLFLDRALEEGAELIATGHYARKLEILNPKNQTSQQEVRSMKEEVGSETIDSELRITNYESNKNENPKQISNLKSQISNEATPNSQFLISNYKLLKGLDDNKNQVYFLYNLTQEQLSHVLFPIGHLTKPEVRKIAEEKKLPNAKKPDSQGICFIGEINVLKFLMSRIPKNPGDIVDIETNKKVGEHEGIYFYTLGQRAKISGQLEPYFYCGKDNHRNIMFVCHGHENPKLFTKVVELENLHLVEPAMSHELRALSEAKTLMAMIRYRQKPQPGKLQILEIPDRVRNEIPEPKAYGLELTARFVFDESQWAVASGQSLVLFDGEECLGGGIIK